MAGKIERPASHEAGEIRRAGEDDAPAIAAVLGHLVLVATGALTADRNLVVPTNKKLYVLANQTTGGHNVIIKTAAGTGIAAANDGSLKLVYCNGANVLKVS